MTGPALAGGKLPMTGLALGAPAAGRSVQPVLELAAALKRRGSGDRVFELSVPRLALRPGEAVAFVGPSGSGKSTLIDILAMTLQPDQAGRFVFVDPRARQRVDVMALWRRRQLDALARLRGRAFGYVLQTGGLLPFISVRDNIALPQKLLGISKPDLITALAERLGIDDLFNRLPAKLSVGQRQRAAIARALAHAPSIVLADEPTASLDPGNALAVMDLFMELITTFRVTLVIATHDASLVARYGLPVVEGRVSQAGTTTRTVFGHDPAAGVL